MRKYKNWKVDAVAISLIVIFNWVLFSDMSQIVWSIFYYMMFQTVLNAK